MGFQTYMERVRSQLECNTDMSKERDYIVFTYSEEQVNQERVYFMRCMRRNLSPYKALTFFHDWLEDQKDLVNRTS